MNAPRWLDRSDLRIGLGCMRLWAADRDEEAATATVAAALAAGITVFDTAHAYGPSADDPGGNERRLAASLRAAGAARTARLVTKGGMRRSDAGWQPDGRARTIRSDCEASLAALDGLPIDLYLIHAPDPRTPWRTSLRALARLFDEGLVAQVGVSNVNRRQLDEAVAEAPIAAVQVALSVFDDGPLRGAVVERCAELGLALIAHSPLGGPRRAGRLARDPTLAQIAAAHGVTPAQVALGWLLDLSPLVVAIPGAGRPEHAQAAAQASHLELTDVERGEVQRRFSAGSGPAAPARGTRRDGEVVLVMGIPGAGKSRVAGEYVGRGYRRLNRDERGGSLRDLADALAEELAVGRRRLVLDNTYLTRAARNRVVEAAARHGLQVRCVWLDTPLAQAQINIVLRLLARFGTLPEPEELRRHARAAQGVLSPTSQMRALRELEPPAADEGFAAIERCDFSRAPDADADGGVFVAARALDRDGWREALAAAAPTTPHLVFDWRQDATSESVEAERRKVATVARGVVAATVCPHGGGPPICWCRPPLPGLLLAFAREQGIEPARSVLVGHSPTHRSLAGALGARYVEV